MLFSYKPSYDKSISDNLKKRFQKEVEVLEREGFRFFSLHQERIWPFSVLLFFPVYVLMAGNEDVRIESPLRITSYHLLYVSKDQATFAYVFGLGCKFYTKFMDGTWLVSNTAQSLRDAKVVVQKRDEDAATTEQVWRKHNMKIQDLQEKGLQLATPVSFEDWVELESRFDRGNVISVLGMGIIWMIILIWAVYWLITSGTSLVNAIF